MRCRAASVGAILQVIGTALALSSIPVLAPVAGLLGGSIAGSLSHRDGHRAGLLAGGTGLAALGLSVVTLSVLGTPAVLPSLPLLAAGGGATLVLATAGGVAGGRLRSVRPDLPGTVGDGA